MRNLFLFSALCLSVSAVGRADTTFSLLNATFDSGGTASGTVTIDTTNGIVDSENIVFNQGGASYLFSGTQAQIQQYPASSSEYIEYIFDAGFNSFSIDLPVGSLVGYAGGFICSESEQLCGNDSSGFLASDFTTQYLAQTGSLGMTPEPSSLILLGTGLLGTVGAVRRRLFSR